MKLVDTVNQLLARKSNDIWAVSPDSSVYEAVEILSQKNIGALLVMEDDQLVGIFSERDYARKVILKGKSSRGTKIREIMISPVITVTPEHNVEECMKIMSDKRIRHLPVVSDGRVVGVLSIGDLVNWIINAQGQAIDQLQGYITGKYPG